MNCFDFNGLLTGMSYKKISVQSNLLIGIINRSQDVFYLSFEVSVETPRTTCFYEHIKSDFIP